MCFFGVVLLFHLLLFCIKDDSLNNNGWLLFLKSFQAFLKWYFKKVINRELSTLTLFWIDSNKKENSISKFFSFCVLNEIVSMQISTRKTCYTSSNDLNIFVQNYECYLSNIHITNKIANFPLACRKNTTFFVSVQNDFSSYVPVIW